MRINTVEIKQPITSGVIDSFGKIRISNPEVVFYSKMTTSSLNVLWDELQTSGSGTTGTYNTNQASYTIAVANLTAGERVRQTFMRFNYMPAKSQHILLTGVLGTIKSGITAGLGTGDEKNGLFFYRNGSSVGVKVRTFTSCVAVDTDITQSNWDDPMDGTGRSKINLDFSKTQIFSIDYEWLGVGSIRFGFFIDGQYHLAHVVHNGNILDKVYMSTPNLPLRFWINNDGTGVQDEILQICSSVISEGGAEPKGKINYKSTNGTAITLAATNTIYPIIGLRLLDTSAIIDLLVAGITIHSVQEKIEWLLIFNPVVTGTFTYSAEPNTLLESAVGNGTQTITGGIKITGGYLSSGDNRAAGGNISTDIVNAIRLGVSIAGVKDTIVLCARPVYSSTAVAVEGFLNWKELN